jgi:hypothetical protein
MASSPCSVVSVNTETEPKEPIPISFGTEDFQEPIGTYFVRNRICASTEEPNRSVVLPVTFGETRENYHTEYIKFKVADFETSYHAILGRTAIAKFMAVPHYTYLVLKMPSLAGVLSPQGDLKISFDCDTEAVELTATNQVPNAMMEIYAASKKLAST